jgi:hypothetical protein
MALADVLHDAMSSSKLRAFLGVAVALLSMPLLWPLLKAAAPWLLPAVLLAVVRKLLWPAQHRG